MDFQLQTFALKFSEVFACLKLLQVKISFHQKYFGAYEFETTTNCQLQI